MKKLIVTLLVGLLCGSTVNADWTQDLGGATLAPGATFGGFFPVPDGPAVDGMQISFDITGITGSGSWASDMQFSITGPSGSNWIIGGFTNSGDADQGWDFDGPSSTNDGFYTHSIENPFDSNGNGTTAAGGTWQWTMTNDWDSTAAATVTISNLSLTLTQVPEPSSLLLLAAAGIGLLGRRRR